MIRSELVAMLVRENPKLTKVDAEKIVRSVFNAITQQLAEGGRVELRGFGAFTVRRRDAWDGHNPRTGESVAVEAKSIPFFKVGKELHRRLNSD